MTATLYAAGAAYNVIPGNPSAGGGAVPVLYPSGGDDTAQMMAAIANVGPYGGMILALPNSTTGRFQFPNGITNTKPGVVIVGLSSRVQGPGGSGSNVGTVFVTTAAGAWNVQHLRPPGTPASNEYRGIHLVGITLLGNNVTAGGFYSDVCHNVLELVQGHSHTSPAAWAHWMKAPAISGGSAQRQLIVDCGALNCGNGIKSETNDGSEIRGYTTLRTSAAPGLYQTGVAACVADGNTSLIVGKLEGHAIGLQCLSQFTTTAALKFETNVLDVDCYRGGTAQSWTSNDISGSFGSARCGPWNFGDSFRGGREPHTFTDVPNPTGIAKHTQFHGDGALVIPDLGSLWPTAATRGNIVLGGSGRLFIRKLDGSWIEK